MFSIFIDKHFKLCKILDFICIYVLIVTTTDYFGNISWFKLRVSRTNFCNNDFWPFFEKLERIFWEVQQIEKFQDQKRELKSIQLLKLNFLLEWKISLFKIWFFIYPVIILTAFTILQHIFYYNYISLFPK